MIHFGTDGWRAVIADEFTFENVRRVARALGEYLTDLGDRRPLAVGYDTRFLSAEFAATAAGTLAQWGRDVFMGDSAIPTPCLSYNVRRMGLSCGLMITASHNPPRYSGVKFKASYGGTVPAAFIDEVARRLDLSRTPPCGVSPGRVRSTDFISPYLDAVSEQCNMDLIRGLSVEMIFDPMYGAAGGLLPRLLEGGRLRVGSIRSEENPGFGGCAPEPIERNLGPLIGALRESHGAIGLVTDGDGDRLAAVDEEGQWVNPHRLFAVLLRHLASRVGYGRKNRVVKTVSTTGMIDKLAAARGLEVIETEIGFKHIVPHVLSGNVLMAGEESGGFCFEGYIPERDGLLSGLKLLEAMATSGRSLAQLVREVLDEVGPHHYARIDRPVESDPRPIFRQLYDHWPSEVAGHRVIGVQRKDGLKMQFDDGSWLLVRLSGTEPVVRFYAESPSETEVQRLLDAAGELWTVNPNNDAGS